MATYYNNISWHEDYYGAVVCRLVISDSHSGLFETGIKANCFSIADASKKLTGEVGGIEEADLSLELDEAEALSTDEVAAATFIKEARNGDNKRFAAIFINTTATPSIADCLCLGVLQQTFDGEDTQWHSGHFTSAPDPLRTWKIKAIPYGNGVLDAVEYEKLINTDPDDPVNYPGIGAAWETANVGYRPGYFDTDNRQVMHGDLVSLDKLLRKLADNLSLAINKRGYGNISIVFESSELDGKFHPARWRHLVINGNRHARFQSIVPSAPADKTKSAFFDVYADDYVRLKIDPDGPGNTSNSIWISYRNVKPIDKEPQKDAAKEFTFSKSKTFKELLYGIAYAFGCYVSFTWPDQTTIKVTFTSRQNFVSSNVYLRAPIKASLKMSAEDIKDAVVKSKANYLAVEGYDVYSKNTDPLSVVPSEAAKVMSSNNQLLLTISPTLCLLSKCKDAGIELPLYNQEYSYPAIPHNSFFFAYGTNEGRDDGSAFGAHNAIYLKVPKYVSHENDAQAPSEYWTPAARLTLSINNQDQEFSRLSDYLNAAGSNDLIYLKDEYNLTIPGFYWFSANADGSSPDWKALQLGSKITLDGLEYTVKEIKWNFASKEVDLVLNAKTRYNYNWQTTQGLQDTDSPSLFIPVPPMTTKSINANEKTAHEAITAFQVVSLRTDNTVEVAHAFQSHYGRVYGIALNDAVPGETVSIQTEGKAFIPDGWGDLAPTTKLYLREIPGLTDNISTQWIKGARGEECLYQCIGSVASPREIEIKIDQPWIMEDPDETSL